MTCCCPQCSASAFNCSARKLILLLSCSIVFAGALAALSDTSAGSGMSIGDVLATGKEAGAAGAASEAASCSTVAAVGIPSASAAARPVPVGSDEDVRIAYCFRWFQCQRLVTTPFKAIHVESFSHPLQFHKKTGRPAQCGTAGLSLRSQAAIDQIIVCSLSEARSQASSRTMVEERVP